MNVRTFLDHWKIRRNPFADEEARHDEVFLDLLDDSFEHFELPKILGDVRHPASAVVFGEKGSGKTAIRMQLQAHFAKHNREHPDEGVFVVAYDDLNPVLDHLSRRVRGKEPLDTLRKMTLNDHIDGVLSVAVPSLVDRAIGERADGGPGSGTDPDARQRRRHDRSGLRRLSRAASGDWLLLQALYDHPDRSVARGRALRRRLHIFRWSRIRLLRALAVLGWLLTAAGGVYLGFFGPPPGPPWAAYAGLAAIGVLTLLLTTIAALDWARVRRLAGRLSKQLRVLDRPADSFRRSLERLPRDVLDTPLLPIDDLDEARYEMIARLRRAIAAFGHRNTVVLLDRIDEPTLVNGDSERMRAVVWPLMNNKFLQQPGFAIKMMLPLELRYQIQGESRDFFQAARLDKQNMVDRLQWTGATLYDLCNRRIRACSADEAGSVEMRDLFEDDTSRQDLLAALDQMRQPRDAFKLVYQIIQHHCASVTEEEEAWQIPKHVVDDVLGRQKERLDALRSGLAPA